METLLVVVTVFIVLAIFGTIGYIIYKEYNDEDKRSAEWRLEEIKTEAKLKILNELVEEYDLLRDDIFAANNEEVYDYAYNLLKVRRAEILKYFEETLKDDEDLAMRILTIYLSYFRESQELD